MKNNVEISNNTVKVFCSSPAIGDKVVFIDLDIYLSIENLNRKIYVARSSTKAEYYCAYIKINNKNISLHKFIMNTPSGMVVDHINGNTLDNRRENIRICTRSQNQQNVVLAVTNKSGVRGVHWHKGQKVWRASIRSNGKKIMLGNFLNKEDAIKARLKAEEEYFTHSDRLKAEEKQ